MRWTRGLMLALRWTIVMKRELRLKAKLFNLLAGLSHRDSMRSLGIQTEIREEPQLLYVERSQLRFFRHLIRMPPVCLTLVVPEAHWTVRRSWGWPRTHWRDYLPHLAWECHIINVESSPFSAAYSGLESFLADLQWLVDKSNGFEYVRISCFCLSFMKVNKES